MLYSISDVIIVYIALVWKFYNKEIKYYFLLVFKRLNSHKGLICIVNLLAMTDENGSLLKKKKKNA